MTAFFRPEVLQRRQRDAVGRVLVVQPLPTGALTALLLAVAAAAGTCLALGPWARTPPRQSVIVAAPASIAARTTDRANGTTLRRLTERVFPPREPAAGRI